MNSVMKCPVVGSATSMSHILKVINLCLGAASALAILGYYLSVNLDYNIIDVLVYFLMP